MNPYTLRFSDSALEKTYKESLRASSRKTLFLLYSLATLLQLLGLLLILSNESISLDLMVTWVFVPISAVIIGQVIIKKYAFLHDFALLVQRFEIAVYFMELLIPHVGGEATRRPFFLGLVMSCAFLNWNEGSCWIFFSLEVLLNFTYFFIKVTQSVLKSGSGPGDIFLYLIVVWFLAFNRYYSEKNQRKTFLKIRRLSNEKVFWRNFIENAYQEPGFILKVAENGPRFKNPFFSVKAMIKGKGKTKTATNGAQIGGSSSNNLGSQTHGVKLLKKLEYSLGLSNAASRNKLSVFTKEDLIELFRTADLISTDFRNEPSIMSFEEVLNTVALNQYRENYDIRNIKEKNPEPFFLMSVGNKQAIFKKAKVFVAIIGSALKKNFEVLITIHVLEFEEELERLKELDKAKDKILATVTHDLRSPLNGIINFVEQAKEIEDQEERNKLLDYAKINSDLLLNLINDILDFSQNKEGKLRIGISSFGVIALAEEVLKLLEFKAVSKGVKLFLSTNLKEERYCDSDPKRLKQVLINLIGNSLKFTNKGFIRLAISSTPYKNVLKFEVYDTGCGIRKEMINKLFNPYVTFSEAGNNNYGIGLGLSICQSIVQLLGPSEKLFVSSTYGKGTKIGFLLFTNAERAGSLPKNSLNLSDKSVTISKDSAIYVTTGQKGSPMHPTINKGTPNFQKSTLNANSKVESTIFSKFQRSGEKTNTVNPDNIDPTQEKSLYPANDNSSPTLAFKRTSHKKKAGMTSIMEGWGINRTMTIKNADFKPPNDLMNGTLVGRSIDNSSSVLSRSIRVNCSEYFTTFSLLEAESLQGFEIVHEFQEAPKSKDDSVNSQRGPGNEMEEFVDGAQINKPVSFFQEDTMSFFSSESENHRNNLLTSKDSLQRGDEVLQIEFKKQVEKKEQSSFGERSLALKNVRLEKIDEDANEESKQELKTCNKRKKSKNKKAFTFLERSPKQQPIIQDSLLNRHSLNVLVVDDDPFNTMIICRFLEKLSLPLKIDKASNGQEALDYFKQRNRKSDPQPRFHIIFLDCQMPIMNGYEAAKNVKECIKSGLFENCVVIAITAYNIQDEEEKCMLSGMDAVLMKPVSEWEFRDLVNKFLVFEATRSNVL